MRGEPFVLAALLALAAAGAAEAQTADVEAALYRTRLAPNLTVVEGVLEFDQRVIEGGAECAYVVGVTVTDSAQTQILDDRWPGSTACDRDEAPGPPGGSARVVETFRFAVVPGRYSVAVSVEPEGRPDGARRVDLELESLALDALASDLILAREVGLAESPEGGQWTLEKGSVGIDASPYVVRDPSRPSLSYYLEVYARPGSALDCRVRGVIRRPDGSEVVSMRLDDVKLRQSRPVAGEIPLTGLAPGDYEFEVRLEVEDTTVIRARRFAMAEVAPRATRGAPRDRRAEADPLAAYFWALSDAELAELFDGVVVWIASAKQREMFEALTPPGKRRFLTQYFKALESEAESEAAPLEVYLTRVRHVNQAFGEKAGEEGQAGWRTDRGRIYLLRGEPDERLERPFPHDNSPPYEIWLYNIGAGYAYLFVDETRFNHHRLLYSTDPNEPPLPGWQRRAGRGAIEELERYFGARSRLPSR